MTNPRCAAPILSNGSTPTERAGAALEFARGGALPERVTEATWRADMKRALKRLTEAAGQFRRRPSWSTYQVIVDRLTQVRSVVTVMGELGLFLTGITGKAQDEARTWGERQDELAFERIRALVGPWIQQQMRGPDAHRTRAAAEWTCWRAVGETPAETQVRDRVNRDAERTLLVVPTLSNTIHETALLARAARRGVRAGTRGHAFRRTDDGLSNILGLEPNERVRATLWQAMQNIAPSLEQVAAMAQARRDTARRSGYTNAAAMVQVLPVMNPDRMAAALKDALALAAPLVRQHEDTLLQKGWTRWSNNQSATGPQGPAARKAPTDVWVMKGRSAAYPGDEVRAGAQADELFADARWANRPWNSLLLSWQATETPLDLPACAFPAERVRRTVMTDLLGIGGWTVVRADRVGRAPWSLWRYQMTRRTAAGAAERAWVVVAPERPRVHKASDAAYAAYASMLRMRRAPRPGVKGIDPVAVISLPFGWSDDRCVTDLQDLINLAHEVGHALHFLELPGRGAHEFERIGCTLSEYPSVLMEQYALAPDVLRRWSNPRGPRAMQRLAYWRRRVTDHNRLADFAREVEIGLVDLAMHGRARNPDAVVRRVRRDAGLRPLHHQDARGREQFDFDVLGGLAYCYAACRALAVQRVGLTPTGDQVRAAVQTYLERVAPETPNPAFAQSWSACYGRDPDSDTEVALARHVRRLIKREKTLNR